MMRRGEPAGTDGGIRPALAPQVGRPGQARRPVPTGLVGGCRPALLAGLRTIGAQPRCRLSVLCSKEQETEGMHREAGRRLRQCTGLRSG